LVITVGVLKAKPVLRAKLDVRASGATGEQDRRTGDGVLSEARAVHNCDAVNAGFLRSEVAGEALPVSLATDVDMSTAGRQRGVESAHHNSVSEAIISAQVEAPDARVIRSDVSGIKGAEIDIRSHHSGRVSSRGLAIKQAAVVEDKHGVVLSDGSVISHHHKRASDVRDLSVVDGHSVVLEADDGEGEERGISVTGRYGEPILVLRGDVNHSVSASGDIQEKRANAGAPNSGAAGSGVQWREVSIQHKRRVLLPDRIINPALVVADGDSVGAGVVGEIRSLIFQVQATQISTSHEDSSETGEDLKIAGDVGSALTDSIFRIDRRE